MPPTTAPPPIAMGTAVTCATQAPEAIAVSRTAVITTVRWKYGNGPSIMPSDRARPETAAVSFHRERCAREIKSGREARQDRSSDGGVQSDLLDGRGPRPVEVQLAVGG